MLFGWTRPWKNLPPSWQAWGRFLSRALQRAHLFLPMNYAIFAERVSVNVLLDGRTVETSLRYGETRALRGRSPGASPEGVNSAAGSA